MNAARPVLADDPAFCFARRVITRPAQEHAEDHDSMSLMQFAAEDTRGAFALTWQAHGLFYGIPRSIVGLLASGCHVVANVSRAAVPAAERLGYPVLVLYVTAPAEILAQRLAGRGRESAAEIAERLAREAPLELCAARLVEISNGGTLEQGARAFVDALAGLRRITPAGHEAIPA